MSGSVELDGAEGGSSSGGAWPRRPRLAPAVVVGSVAVNLLALGLPLVVLQVYDRVLPNNATATLSVLMIGLVVVMVLDLAIRIARAHLVAWSAARHYHRLAADAVERLLEASPGLIEKESPSIHADRFRAIETLRDFYGGQSRLLLLDLPFILVFATLIGLIGEALVLVPVALLLIFGATTLISGRKLREVMSERSDLDDRKYDFIIEALDGIQTVKALAMEPQIMRRFERLQRACAETAYRMIIQTNAARSSGSLFANLTMIAVVAAGAVMVIDGRLTVGALACCTLLSGRMIQPVLKGLNLWAQVQSLAVARRRVGELLALPDVKAPEGRLDGEIRGDVVLEQASFVHPGTVAPAVDSVDLRIAAGEIVGIRGAAGSGKTTLLHMLAGHVVPTSGRVLVGGHDLGGANRDDICRALAYVPQNCAIFRGTVLENLTMFRTGEAVDAARAAAQTIGLEEDIHKLPAGYDTVLGEGITDELPRGMMQRIIIARALARRPKVLLFDEANRQLDARGDRLLRQGFEALRGETTIVLVSLRPSLLKIADRVFEMKAGRLVPDQAHGMSARESHSATKVIA